MTNLQKKNERADKIRLSFTKMSGTQNSFFFILEEGDFDRNISNLFKTEDRGIVAKKIIEYDGNQNADGVAFLKTTKSEDAIIWDFYNADGSTAEMCGNAARCVYSFMKKKKNFSRESITLHTQAGEVFISQNKEDEKKIEVIMPEVHFNKEGSFSFNREVLKYHHVNTGVPHLVFFREKFHIDSLREIARQIDKDLMSGSLDKNITFFSYSEGNIIETATYERGIRDFTQSCGTGAVAAAVVSKKMGNDSGLFSLRVPGGSLQVCLKKGTNSPVLIGETKFHYDISFYEGVF